MANPTEHGRRSSASYGGTDSRELEAAFLYRSIFNIIVMKQRLHFFPTETLQQDAFLQVSREWPNRASLHQNLSPIPTKRLAF